MKLHLVQIHPELNDKAANREKILAYVARSLDAGANLIAFGECALNGYELSGMVDYAGLAESVPGPTTEAIAKLLKGRPALVLFGMAERTGADVYNAAPLIGPEGVIGVARKLYLVHFQAKSSGRIYNEKLFFKPGERIAVFDTGFGRIAVQICLDNRHPEIAHAQAIAGCWLKLRPAAIPYRNNQPDVNSLDLARGIENQTCDCTINLVGEQGASFYRGGTYALLGARGVQKQASVGKKAVEEILKYEVSEEDVRKARGNWHNISEVRPELIKQLWEIATERQSGTGRE